LVRVDNVVRVRAIRHRNEPQAGPVERLEVETRVIDLAGDPKRLACVVQPPRRAPELAHAEEGDKYLNVFNSKS
jgi:hypothetical protein